MSEKAPPGTLLMPVARMLSPPGCTSQAQQVPYGTILVLRRKNNMSELYVSQFESYLSAGEGVGEETPCSPTNPT